MREGCLKITEYIERCIAYHGKYIHIYQKWKKKVSVNLTSKQSPISGCIRWEMMKSENQENYHTLYN